MINVLFFAALRDIVSAGEDQPPRLEPATPRRLFDDYARRFPALERYRTLALVAVNQQYVADWDTPLSEDDEVAFFPPVSGGAR